LHLKNSLLCASLHYFRALKIDFFATFPMENQVPLTTQPSFAVRMPELKGVVFDLDGVLVDTARFHDQAWAELANGLGYQLQEHDRHALKGRSRADSLDYILAQAGWETANLEQKSRWMQAKNTRYLELVESLTPHDTLAGAVAFLTELREHGVGLALGSSSQNATVVLRRIGLDGFFDTVVDGTRTVRSKPDPEVFLLAASDMGLSPEQCWVVEDAAAGVEAALAGGFGVVGLGNPEVLRRAHRVVSDLSVLNLKLLTEWHRQRNSSHQDEQDSPSV
jgi:beta-phosphoglucomutase